MLERRISPRAQTDLPVSALVDGFWHNCRAVDISPTGMVLERTNSLARRLMRQLNAVALWLGHGPLTSYARTVWTKGRFMALRFVVMSDVDRLTIAEELDRKTRLHEPLH